MSFILDALRKSDSRRQQSGAPGLNSPEPPSPPRRRRRRLLPWLAVGMALFAIAAAAVYILRPGWLVSGDETAPQQSEAAPSEIQPSSGTASEAAVDQTAQENTPTGPVDQPEAPPKAIAEEDAAVRERVPGQEENAGEEGKDALRDRRQPIRASPERTVRRETPPRESRPMPADEATKELERRLAAEALRRRESRSEPTPIREPSRPADRSGEASKPKPKPLNEGVAEYVRTWELPLSVRRSLPEMDLSIHVFSPNEAERFVLINGERYVPGDSIGEARIVDISRDGAIVDFHSHRFLLEPR